MARASSVPVSYPLIARGNGFTLLPLGLRSDILVYRKRSASAVSVPAVPKYQADEIIAVNKCVHCPALGVVCADVDVLLLLSPVRQADRDRVAYQDAMNTISVYLHLPARYAVSGPVLMSTIDPQDKKRENEGIIEIQVDQRKPIRSLYRAIATNIALQKLLDLPADVACPENPSGKSRCLGPDSWCSVSAWLDMARALRSFARWVSAAQAAPHSAVLRGKIPLQHPGPL